MAEISRDWAHLKSILGLHVELPANPNGPAGNPIVLLPRDPLPSSENITHPPVQVTAFPLSTLCIDDKPIPSSSAPTILKYLMGSHYGNLLSCQSSFPVPNALLPQHSLVNSHVSMLEDIEEEIIFCYSDDRGCDDEDILLEIEPCIPFASYTVVPPS